jgi:hypothetical protein
MIPLYLGIERVRTKNNRAMSISDLFYLYLKQTHQYVFAHFCLLSIYTLTRGFIIEAK